MEPTAGTRVSLFSRQSSNGTSSATRAFISRTLTFRRRGSGRDDTNDDPLPPTAREKGPLGLTTVHDPDPDQSVVADIVFVHGLNGGSQSTWCKGGKPCNFWPGEWLPSDEAFQDARIHSFGYPSALSRESILNVTDFARSLLAAVNDSPAINSRVARPRLIFVAHSMGGLVVKKAYILSHQEAEFKSIAERVCSIFFLATPHQGAAIAQSLARLAAVVGARPFVDDLLPHSPAIRSINEDFPQISEGIQLMSFFETRPMRVGLTRTHIVDKSSAVMNLSNERRTLLDADHRNVAMYSSQHDSAFVAVRNALATVISSQRDTSLSIRRVTEREDRRALTEFLSVSDAPEDDILVQDGARVPGSCQWLLDKDYYQAWKEAMDSRFLWLRGRPGVGKSVLVGHVVNDLRDRGLDCCFFFFKASDESRSTVNSFLRSMAWQMAMLHPVVLAKIKECMSEGPVDRMDPNPVWRKVFLAGMLEVRLDKPQFWVIDALDECKGSADAMRFISRIQERWPVSVLATCRDSPEAHHGHYLGNDLAHVDIQHHTISDQDTIQDITLLLKANLDHLPCPASVKWPTRWALASHIIDKSEGSFLWASLMCSELRQVTSEKEIDMVVDSTPSNMDALYSKILADMARERFGNDTARALITWTTYAFRPLRTSELHETIEMDIHDKIDDLERTISKCCGSLVFVDRHKKVQLVHATAREFLTRKGTDSEFTVTRAEGHRRLAIVCLNYLLTRSVSKHRGKGRRLGSSGVASSRSPTPTSSPAPFIDYASNHLFQHLANVSPIDSEMLAMLSEFLGSTSLLQWIEYLATQGDLQTLHSAGMIINNLVPRPARQPPPVSPARRQDKLALLDRWGNDLVHLATKFSHHLKQSPTSIHHLIPPFCPPNSAIRRQFSNPYRGLNVQGLSAREWDDCLATITYPTNTKPNTVATGPGHVAVGMMSLPGLVFIYDDSIFQEIHTLQHGEPVWRLSFSCSGKLLASAGAKTVRIWSCTDGTQQTSFTIPSLCLSLAFGDDDMVLRVATRQNRLVEWDVQGGAFYRDQPATWERDLEERMQGRTPMLVCIGSAVGMVAVLYRGESIVLWDYVEGCIYDLFEKETGSVTVFGSHKLAEGVTTVRAATFSEGLGTSLFAVTYADGDLVVYDIESGKPTAMAVGANTMELASSRDGRTLVGMDSWGNVTLFEFETLRKLYRICFETQMIAKCLAFTANSLRFVEIREGQCRVWEPSVLLQSDGAADGGDSQSPQEVSYQPVGKQAPDITAVTCCRDSGIVFCGTEDGAVHVYDIAGQELQKQALFVQTPGCAVHLLQMDESASVLACGDQSGRVTARKVARIRARQSSPRQRAAWHWQADEIPLTDTLVAWQTGGLLKQVLVSAKQKRLLISTEKWDTLWSIPKQGEDVCITQIEANNKHSPRWMGHPNGETLMGIHNLENRNSAIGVYNWSNLELVRSIPVVEGVRIDRIMPLHNHQYFTTYSNNTTTTNSIHMWNSNTIDTDISPTNPPLTPLAHHLDTLPSQVETIIGTFGTRLIFYTSDHWIASVQLSSPPPATATGEADINDPPATAAGSFVRHFFLPNDWLGSNASRPGRKELIFGLGCAGEVVFVKRCELAVVKRGVEVTENGVGCDSRGGGLGGRSMHTPKTAV